LKKKFVGGGCHLQERKELTVIRKGSKREAARGGVLQEGKGNLGEIAKKKLEKNKGVLLGRGPI